MTPYYQEPGITIWHADFRDVTPNLAPVNVTMTDPPYSEHTHSKQWIDSALTDGAARTGMKFKELGFASLTAEVQAAFLYEAQRLTERWVLAFCDLESITPWKNAVIASGLEYVRACVWDKVDSAPQFTGDRPAASAEGIIVAHPFDDDGFDEEREAELIVCAHRPGKKRWNGGGKRNVFRHPVNGRKRGPKPHPSTKPLSLMMELVTLFTEPGEMILDTFMGSGRTLLAAKQLGRLAIGIDNDEACCETAVKELQQAVVDFAGGVLPQVETGTLF